MSVPQLRFRDYRLADRYDLPSGRVFLTGTQALARILFDQARRDREAGLKTGGFVSGYRGSPLGALDLELWRCTDRLAERSASSSCPPSTRTSPPPPSSARSRSRPTPAPQVDGVFAMWYGKGPGVDRAGDALKHGNAYGSSPRGGVLVVAGDDHGCVSSSMPHQSDVAFMAWFMPTLNPASVAEYLSFGEYGYALSRFSGMWVGFKAISETVESGQSVELPPDRRFTLPDFAMPPGGLHYRWPDLPGPQIEERMEAKKHAAWAFAEANPIDRAIYGIPDARYGFVTTGKGHLDLMEALRLLGLDEARLPPPRHRHLQGRHGLAAGLARRARLRARQAGGPGRRGEARHHREPAQGIFLRLPRPQARAHGRQARRGRRRASSPGPASSRPASSSPLVARRLDRLFPERGPPAPRRGAGRAAASCSRSPAPPAPPISAPAARTTPRPRCPRAARRWPASAATSWRAGWTARPRRSSRWAARA